MTRKILGTGWKFPIRVDARGGLAYAREEQSVQEAIWIILGTAPGERRMRPQFGCGIHELVFAPNNPSTRGNVAHQVRQALTRWEPRIDVLSVQVDGDTETPNLLLIRVDYRIRTSNSMQNLVYPFYIRNEGGG
ncbi:MAG: GPW/gp25 family protein [Anaerolineales bacterium]|nr:GPW/gp25 family protein [Anaerolineales bacterium]MCB8986633.1 GPW/gp25 family protein [Ardenticatenaceae bacterium]